MGTHYNFFCKTCGYSTQVSGGVDCGFTCRTSTIFCEECKELFDVVTTEEPWLVMRSDWKPGELNCPASDKHKIRLWNHPDKCPKCNSDLEQGEVAALWD